MNDKPHLTDEELEEIQRQTGLLPEYVEEAFARIRYYLALPPEERQAYREQFRRETGGDICAAEDLKKDKE